MEKVTMFKTKDGKIFEVEAEAKQHEIKVFSISLLDKMLFKYKEEGIQSGKDFFEVLESNKGSVLNIINLLGDKTHE